MPVFLVLEMDLVPLMSRVTSSGVFCGICELSMTLGSLSTNGSGGAPVLLVVWYEVSSAGACWLLGGAWSWF